MNKPHATTFSRKRLYVVLVGMLILLAYLWYSHPLRQDTHPLTNLPAVKKTIPWVKIPVTPGSSLSKLMSANNIPYSTVLNILKLPHTKALKNLQPDTTIEIQIKNQQLTALRMPISDQETLLIQKIKSQFTSKLLEHQIQTNAQYASGTIQNSVAQAFQRDNLPTSLLSQFEHVFSWKVNFSRELQPGAKFALLYEKHTRHIDKKIKNSYGPIIAAELTNNGKTLTAIRYTTADGKTNYYSADGSSLSGRFLKAPIHYKRVSSPFSLHRWHPILHKYQPHFGVDLAAPIGTPIHAAADGVIKLRRSVRGYGRTIYIRHNFEYSTRYAHLHKYAKNLKVGQAVRKGQIIGYVGKSGLATGPHLHYEIRKFGIPRNPMTLKLPSAAPIPKQQRKQFFAFANQQLFSMRNDSNRVRTADNNKQKLAPKTQG